MHLDNVVTYVTLNVERLNNADLLGFYLTTISRVKKTGKKKNTCYLKAKDQTSMSNLEAAAKNTLLAHQKQETQTTICMGSPNTNTRWKSIAWSAKSQYLLPHLNGRVGIEIHEGPILTSINGLGWLW